MADATPLEERSLRGVRFPAGKTRKRSCPAAVAEAPGKRMQEWGMVNDLWTWASKGACGRVEQALRRGA